MGDDPALKYEKDINEITHHKTNGASDYDCMVKSKDMIKHTDDEAHSIYCFTVRVSAKEIQGSGVGWMIYSETTRQKPFTLILDFFKGDFGYFQGKWETIEKIAEPNNLENDYEVTTYMNVETCNIWYIINGVKTNEVHVKEIEGQTIYPVIWRAGQDKHKVHQVEVPFDDMISKPENWLNDHDKI